jgi:hypothetical protein
MLARRADKSKNDQSFCDRFDIYRGLVVGRLAT